MNIKIENKQFTSQITLVTFVPTFFAQNKQKTNQKHQKR